MKKLIAKRKGYAAGGMIPRSGKTDMWIDNIPVDQYERAFSADRKLTIKPKMDIDDGITTGPQSPYKYMENSRGGKVKKVTPVVRKRK